jgi:hypothetical protein
LKIEYFFAARRPVANASSASPHSRLARQPRRLQLRDRPAIETDQLGEPGTIGIGHRRMQGGRVAVGAEKHRL